jgi:hypothetical protein
LIEKMRVREDGPAVDGQHLRSRRPPRSRYRGRPSCLP